MPDARQFYRVRLDAALAAGAGEIVEAGHVWPACVEEYHRAAALAVREAEEWELERTGWRLLDDRWWYFSDADAYASGPAPLIQFSRHDDPSIAERAIYYSGRVPPEYVDLPGID